MTISVSFSWWWLLWIAAAIWLIGAVARLWVIAAFAGRSCIKPSDIVMAFLWPVLPVIGFFSVFWEKLCRGGKLPAGSLAGGCRGHLG